MGSLVLENKIPQAINIDQEKIVKKNSNFFDADLLMILDSLKKNDLDAAYTYLIKSSKIKNFRYFKFSYFRKFKTIYICF